MTSLHNIRLPHFISVFCEPSFEFATSCVTTISGREVRTMDANFVRQKYLIKNCRLSMQEFMEFNNFFLARHGQKFAFLLHNLLDCKVYKQVIAIGDGKTTEFALIKTYYDPVFSYCHQIKKIVKNSLVIYIDNQEVKEDFGHMLVDLNSGLLTLPQALEQGAILSVDFKFDIAVRFSKDNFDYSFATDGSIELGLIEMIEVIDE